MTSLISIGLLLLGLQTPAPSAQGSLRIAVVQGEDAVNIIQQKTAVAPIVEIRDRNNLPVAGATVTFSITGSGASFGGLSTLTVTTNAAGQAAAVGFTPTAAGAIQINASALVQGQALTATITQTNVMTAAQAVGAAGATGGAGSGGGAGGAGGGAAAGGGGISGTTIGIVGGAVAAVGGGALIATQVAGDSETEFVGTFQGQMNIVFGTCTRTHENSGTVTIYLETLEGPITGDAKVEGTSRVAGLSGTSCIGGPQIGSSENVGITNTTPVSGSPSNLTFSKQESNSVPVSATNPVAGTHTVTFSFTGTLSGDTITGTLVHTERSESSGFTPATGAASYPLTLRKQ
jgi:hypothetical protein